MRFLQCDRDNIIFKINWHAIGKVVNEVLKIKRFSGNIDDQIQHGIIKLSNKY